MNGIENASQFYTAALRAQATEPGAAAPGASFTSASSRAGDFTEGEARPGFAETVAQAAEKGVQTVARGEFAAQEMMVGRADAHSVVEALAQAELALETAVTVRDKVVQAYQEILRMPI